MFQHSNTSTNEASAGDLEWPRGYRLNHKKTGKLYIPDDVKHLVLNEFHPRDTPKRKGTHHGQRRTHRKV